jgi:hypothetical protein
VFRRRHKTAGYLAGCLLPPEGGVAGTGRKNTNGRRSSVGQATDFLLLIVTPVSATEARIV